MAVYVDNYGAGFGRMVMCHMAADTIGELHDMADRIGVARKWFQLPNGRNPHYDICKSKRAMAVQFGAIECEPRDIVPVVKRCLASMEKPAGAGG